jgi:hypothetical protein
MQFVYSKKRELKKDFYKKQKSKKVQFPKERKDNIEQFSHCHHGRVSEQT